MAKYSTLSALFTAIANSLRGKTGGTGAIVADDFPTVIDGLSTAGITPTGTKTITENGSHDVTNCASALVDVAGLNARVFTSTVSANVTSGTATIASANSFIASIRSNANAFIFVRLVDVPQATAGLTAWFNTNAKLAWRASSNGYNAISVRQSATYEAVTLNVNGLTGTNYNGHLTVSSDGKLTCTPSTTYPLLAGTYQIIAGTLDML